VSYKATVAGGKSICPANPSLGFIVAQAKDVASRGYTVWVHNDIGGEVIRIKAVGGSFSARPAGKDEGETSAFCARVLNFLHATQG
jgi:hypothetical protein